MGRLVRGCKASPDGGRAGSRARFARAGPHRDDLGRQGGGARGGACRGGTMITTSSPRGKSWGCRRNTSRTRRLARLRTTEGPTLREATTPRRGGAASVAAAARRRRRCLLLTRTEPSWMRRNSARLRMRCARGNRLPPAAAGVPGQWGVGADVTGGGMLGARRPRRAAARLLLVDGGGEAGAALAAAVVDDLAPTDAGHPGSEAVRAGAARVVRLVRALHGARRRARAPSGRSRRSAFGGELLPGRVSRSRVLADQPAAGTLRSCSLYRHPRVHALTTLPAPPAWPRTSCFASSASRTSSCWSTLRAAASARPRKYLRLNPHARVPARRRRRILVLYESAAICLHLCERHPDAGLAPPVGSAARAHFYQWMIYLTNTIQADAMLYFYPERYASRPQRDALQRPSWSTAWRTCSRASTRRLARACPTCSATRSRRRTSTCSWWRGGRTQHAAQEREEPAPRAPSPRPRPPPRCVRRSPSRGSQSRITELLGSSCRRRAAAKAAG